MKPYKLYFLLGILMLTSIFSYQTKAQNSLNTGDIAIVGFNSDTPIDELAIVTLAEILAGETIYISDYAWDGSLNALDANGLVEGVITWTITTNIPAGTLFKISINSLSGTPVIGGLSSYGTTSAAGWTSLSSPTISGGDNWFIYQGINATTPTSWVFGFANWSTNLAGTNSWLTAGTPSSTTSYLPSALTNGVNAIALTGVGSHADNMVYVGSTLGDKATLLGSITNISNWSGDEDTPKDLNIGGTNFSGSNPVFYLPPPITPTNNILYVEKNATGNGSGSSWANAIPELADALKWAKQNESNWTNTSPLQIFVAKGTYKPLYSPADTNFGTDQGRDNSFCMVNNVQIYGGFVGTETYLSERDLSLIANTTFLSGDFNGDDIVSASGSTLNHTENAFHVIISAGNMGIATLNGFTVKGGNADGTGSIVVNSNSLYKNIGGGIFNHNASPLLTNLIINSNTADGGAGIYNENANTIVKNVDISKNTANFGGGIYNSNSATILTNVLISGNKANEIVMPSSCSYYTDQPSCLADNGCSWWGICIPSSSSGGQITLYGGYGGGLYNKDSSPLLTNVTICKNQADVDSGGMYNNNSNPELYNNLLIGNTTSASNPGLYNENSTPVIMYSLIQDLTDTSNGNIDATAVTITAIFNDPTNDDYTLKAGSNVINAGNNTNYTNGGGDLTNDTDLAGNPRVFQNTIDMGAYESQTAIITPVNNTLYVDKDATGGGSGSNWADALTDVQTAINAATAGGKIFIKKGEYTLTAAIKMKEGVEIYGSFAGTETDLATRDLSNFANDATNATILKSNGNQRVVTNSFTSGNPMTSATVLDGFVITGGGNTNNGGGIHNSYASPSLSMLIISGNTADFPDSNGGGMFNNNSSPTLTNVSIIGNKVQNGNGGGIYNNFSNPTLTNVSIISNKVQNGDGGGIYNNFSNLTLTNTIVLANTANIYPGITSFSSSISITYSLIQDLTDNTNGNLDATGITATDVFNDPTNGDYTIKSTSPTINAGDKTAYTNAGGDLANDTDLAGNPRLFDGSPTNDIIDMGAYELQEDVLPAITNQPTNVEICNGTTTSFSVTANLATSYQWQVNTGSGFINITNGGIYSDATTSSLSITGATAMLNGYLYRIVISNNAGDTTSNAATLTVNTIILNASQTNVVCNGGANGSATVSVTEGTAPYSYSWSPSGGNSATANGLVAGTYTITVTDDNACTATQSFTITQPTALAASVSSQTNVTCNGDANGDATVSATGGTAPYSYSWSPSGGTGPTATGLSAGTYTVTVTDDNGCTANANATVTQPTIFSANVITTNVNCKGGNNGSADLAVSGGKAPYAYAWSNGAITEDITGLTAGTYAVIVTDANGCTAIESVDVQEPTILSASAVVTHVTCNGSSDGTIDLSVTGGTGAYTYLWSNTATTEDLTGLTAGTYSVTVTDANGCTATESVDVQEPTILSASAVATHITCNGSSDGTIDLNVTGGTAPYTYAWDNSATTEDILGLTAGTYNVTVTDANGCTATASATITESTLLVTNGAITDVSCLGNTDGSIDVTVSGGTTPYTYSWNNAATTEDLSGLAAGTYTVTITDANGCTDTIPFTVNTTPDITAPIADLMNLTDITAQCEVLTTDVPIPTATDNCGGIVTTTHNVTFPITSQGTTVITWTYTDVAGNTTTQNQNVIITDTTAPVADLVTLADVIDQCEVLASNVSVPTATDNCGGVVTATHNVTFPITTQGTTVITWTYIDVNGNTSTQTQNVIITDTTAPIADLPTLADVVMECEVLASDVTIPTATDNCGGVVTVTNDVTFPISTQGITMITWTYTDVNGNTSTQTQNIDVQPSPIANVSFSDATFIYNGNVQNIQVNNLPSGASVTYTTTPATGQANGAIDVGVYTVTAVVSPPVTAVNCSPITLTATLTIEQATQTINFNALPILYIEDDVDFQLQATASSGLPVTYSYTYTSDNPAATVNSTGWVSLLTSGVIQITAQQAGDNNYLPATDIIQALQINSRNANISTVSLNGEVFTNPELDLYYIIDCNNDQDEVTVVLETEVNASVNPSKEFIISTPQPGIFSQDIVVTSQDASVTKTYTITVERRFGFFDIAKQKFDNVLLVNNNPQTNGGYKFVGYEWYIDDRLVSTNQYYSAGGTSQDLLSENASYYLRLETENGEILQTCTGEVSLVHDFKAYLYPNPNQPGRVLNIEMGGLGSTANKEMEINLYSLQGSLIKQWKTQKQMTQVNLPESLMAGVYLVRCSMQGRHRNFKLIIE